MDNLITATDITTVAILIAVNVTGIIIYYRFSMQIFLPVFVFYVKEKNDEYFDYVTAKLRILYFVTSTRIFHTRQSCI